MANLGDIDRQSVAGAAATGTHGTGAWLTGLSAMVAAVELVTALVLDAAVAAPNEPRLASLVADLAELLKGSEHAAARGVTLDQLAERAASLREEGDAEAEEVATLIEHARGIRQADR